MSRVQLLVVEDHPLFRSGMAHMAEHLRPDWALRFVGTAAEALSVLADARPDALVIDVGLPDEDGVSLTRVIGQRWPGLPVLLISARDTPAMAVIAERSGAHGFIGKGEPPDAIAEAIDGLLLGRRRFGSDAAVVPTFSPRQTEVLKLLDAGCSNKEMRHRLGIAERTVRAHLTEVFTLLKVHSRTQALIRARELGLIL